MSKEFFKFVLPSMIAFAFSGVYSIVDGWFIGNYLNEAGLAAINIAYPIAAFIMATGTAIGMGGSIFISICLGRHSLEEQREYLGATMILLIVAGIIEMIAIYFTFSYMLSFLEHQGKYTYWDRNIHNG